MSNTLSSLRRHGYSGTVSLMKKVRTRRIRRENRVDVRSEFESIPTVFVSRSVAAWGLC